MAIRADGIAFDIGNTLVLNPFDDVLASKRMDFERIFSQHGCQVRRDEIADAWHEANRVVSYPHVSHFYQEPKILAHVMERLNIGKCHRAEIVTRLLISYRSGLRYAVTRGRNADEAREAVSELRRRGKKLIVFGNGRQKPAEIFLEWLGIRKHFRSVTMSEKLGLEKPDPRTFTYMLRALGTDRGRTVYVGDSPENDMAPAKKSGLKAALYVPPADKRKETPWTDYSARCVPDATVRSLMELLDVLI